MIMVYGTHTFFYIVCFTIWVNTFEENCCCFITAACLSCKLITQLVTNRTLYFCVRFHFSLLRCNTFVLNNILFKIFIDELLNFRVIWHSTINTYKKIYYLFIIIIICKVRFCLYYMVHSQKLTKLQIIIIICKGYKCDYFL